MFQFACKISEKSQVQFWRGSTCRSSPRFLRRALTTHFSPNTRGCKLQNFYRNSFRTKFLIMYHKQLPNAFNNYFTRIDSMHTYQLRSVKNKVFYTKTASTKQYKSWVSHAGVELWSKIDPSIKELSFKSLSLQLKKDWINEYQYCSHIFRCFQFYQLTPP